MGYRCGRYRPLCLCVFETVDGLPVCRYRTPTSVSVRVRGSGWVTGVVGIVPLPLCLCVFETVDGLPVW